ncbi:unnamed protein product [Hermetia illucens]|uniref:Peptidase A2 domain-containing protein n=1 Tax=Hermetia illucens TaxID=343691 RepID=A0A7R8UH65_HERIL|nr:unnamed protein product [Hermetia illucens]
MADKILRENEDGPYVVAITLGGLKPNLGTVQRREMDDLAPAPEIEKLTATAPFASTTAVSEKRRESAQNRALSGKLVNSSPVGVAQTNRLIIRDKGGGLFLLINTGADVSVIPQDRRTGRNNTNYPKLFAANGTIINTYAS